MYNENRAVMDFDKELSTIYPWILRIARMYCFSVQEAEDLAGETICKMLHNRDKFDCSRSMKTWCITVMKNTYITQYNRKAIVRFTEYDSFAENRYNADSTYDFAFFKDVLSIIRRCAHKSRCIECVLYYAKGYSYEEISQLLNVPIGTVRSRISWGRKVLKEELQL